MSTTSTIPALDDTWGVFLISVIVMSALWGAGTVQLYYYYYTYKKDFLILKLLVALVWAFDTIHLVLEAMSAYFILITNYGNSTYLISTTSKTHIAELFVLFSGFVVLLVQGFYVHRIWQLSYRNHFVAAGLCVLLIAEFTFNTALFSRIYKMEFITQWLEITWMAKVVNALNMGTSILITVLVIFYLHRGRTGFKKTDNIINRLIIFSVNTGLLTSICSTLATAFVNVSPSTFIYIFFYSLQCKMYMNSLLATLNSRSQVANMINNENTDESISFSSILNSRRLQSQQSGTKPIAINIQTESRVRGDTESGRFEKD